MAKKIADQLVETLADAGIKRIYAVTGDSLNQVNDAVRRHKDIEWIHVRHEETGAFAAAADAELSGIACCAGSSGPGHVHLINGLYEAHRNNNPVLAIASTCGTSEFGTDYFQETQTAKLFADCSSYNQVASTPAQLTRMLHGALQNTVQNKEVSVLGLPGDLAALHAENKPTSKFVLPTSVRAVPAESEIYKLAGLINDSQRITLFCGIGCREAHDQVVRLAAKLKAPVAYTFKSKMVVQYDNPYEIGMTGLLGSPAAYRSMHESDLLIMLGTDFPYVDFMPADCTIVQVDIRPERIGRRARVDMGLGGSVRETIAALLPVVEEKTDTSFLDRQLRHYRRVNKHLADSASHIGRKSAITPEYVATLIDNMAAADAIFTVDTGMCCVWGARYLTATGRREMLGSFKHGSMANALPMAIGAALARPGQQVVALCGDGGLSMLLGDLATIMQYELPVKIIVFDNRSLGMVKLEMEVAGLPDWQTDMYNPDFAAVAAAFGFRSMTVGDPRRLEQALRAVFSTAGPVLLHVKTDPDALAMPPRIEFSQAKGFAEAMAKLMFEGRFKEVYNTARSNFKHLEDIF